MRLYQKNETNSEIWPLRRDLEKSLKSKSKNTQQAHAQTVLQDIQQLSGQVPEHLL